MKKVLAKRRVWAEDTKLELEVIQERRQVLQEQFNALEIENLRISDECNHTYKNGTSALYLVQDDPYDYDNNVKCEVCGCC